MVVWARTRPQTAKLRWCLFSSVPHVSDRLELHNNNWASGILHPGLSESDVYSDIIQEAQSNDLLHTVRLSVHLDMPLHGNNARGAKYVVYYTSVVTHTVFENIKWLRSALCWPRNVAIPSLTCLFPARTVLHTLPLWKWRTCREQKKKLAVCVLRVRSMQAASVQHAYCKRTLVRAECLRMRIFGTKRACNMLAANAWTNHNARRMLVMCVHSQHPCVMLAGCLQDAHLAHEIIKDQHEKKKNCNLGFVELFGLNLLSHVYAL